MNTEPNKSDVRGLVQGAGAKDLTDVAVIRELSSAELEEAAGGFILHVAAAASTYAWYKWQKANGGPNWGV
jgi:hypothetical protein